MALTIKAQSRISRKVFDSLSKELVLDLESLFIHFEGILLDVIEESNDTDWDLDTLLDKLSEKI